MSLAHDRRLHEAADLARTLFQENPNLGIDAAARIVNESCKRGLVKHAVSAIRREVRNRIGLTNDNQIQMEESMSPNNVAKLHQKPAPASAQVRATKMDRQKFLETWALENPMATIEQAREALRAEFEGVAMGTKVISDTLRMAKQLWEAQRKEALEKGRPVEMPVLAAVPVTPPTQETPAYLPPTGAHSAATTPTQGTPVLTQTGIEAVQTVMNPIQAQVHLLGQAMKAAGVRLIEVLDNGKIRVEFSGA